MANADEISEFYRGSAGNAFSQKRARDRIHWLVENAHGRVLDLGCSQGIASILCARAGHEVLGIDNEADRIDYALADRERKPAEVRDRLDFRVGDATALDLPDASFDTVLVGEVVEHLADPAPVMREVARVAKPEGTVLLTTPFGYHPHDDHKQTFYVASLVDALVPYFTLESLEIIDRYTRVLARPGAMAAEAVREFKLAVLPRFEQALLEQQTLDWREGRKARRQTARTLREFRREMRRLRREEMRLARRLDAFRRSRWTRLGRALAGARKPRGLVRLPVEVVRALRKQPAPKRKRDRWMPPVLAEEEWTPVLIADGTAGTDAELRTEVPEAMPFPSGPIARPDLRVATILDPFSAAAFRYEWDQIEVGPDDWRERFEAGLPDLLFVESAWRGNGYRWARAVVGSGPFLGEFAAMVAWCRSQGVPTVFWNKEDPPHFSTFVPAARLFDHVLTTDFNRVGAYQEVLGHERASVLRFAAQPRVHHPVAPPGGRTQAVGFAGTYLANKHPARRAQMEMILDPAREFGLHIFSRVPPGEAERFEWPAKYLPHIVGSLPYERMVTAFKAYRLFLNVNSVITSPTMCARRAFEISATGTPLLSGDSLALRNVFGDLIPVATSAKETRNHLEALLGDPELAARRGHAAMRHVMREHTYGHRVDQILRTAGLDQHAARPPARISVAVPLADGEVPRALQEQLASQTRPAHEVIVAPLPAAADRAEGELLALMDPSCDYGENYLEDLAAAFAYTDAAVVGKPMAKGSAAPEHAYSLDLHPATVIVPTALIPELGFDLSRETPGQALLEACRARGLRGYAADRYSFEEGHRVREERVAPPART